MNGGHVRRIPLAFGAEVLDHVAVWKQNFGHLHGYRFGQHHRIDDGDVDVEVPEVTAVEPFLNVHVLTVRVAAGEPCAFVVAVRIDDRVSPSQWPEE